MTVRDLYAARVDSRQIEADPAQQEAAARLDAIASNLHEKTTALSALKTWLGGGSKKWSTKKSPQGLYLWGEVGRGKTMLMDLFYSILPEDLAKRRIHFNAFMNDVHERIFHHRTEIQIGRQNTDPIPHVAEVLAREAKLLCFDEFAVTDIADAMILGRLFSRLFDLGVVVVATSNIEPDRLYEGGLNRSLFLPFVALIKDHMDVFELKARTDYRLEKLSAGETYVVGCGPDTKAALDTIFSRLTGAATAPPRTLTVKGREVVVPQAALGVARFSFKELFEDPLGPADYLALAREFHTVMIDAVPILNSEQKNAAKRFITFIDTLYDQGVKVVMSAAAEPSGLYQGTEGREAFEFKRTASRLIEMRSCSYLARPHGPAAKSPIAEP